MNRVFSAKTNLPVYVGNYPSSSIQPPGLKPRKDDFYYQNISICLDKNNLDKISDSEQSDQIVTNNPSESVNCKDNSNQLVPTFDTSTCVGGTKRKLENLFRVIKHKFSKNEIIT